MPVHGECVSAESAPISQRWSRVLLERFNMGRIAAKSLAEYTHVHCHDPIIAADFACFRGSILGAGRAGGYRTWFRLLRQAIHDDGVRIGSACDALVAGVGEAYPDGGFLGDRTDPQLHRSSGADLRFDTSIGAMCLSCTARSQPLPGKRGAAPAGLARHFYVLVGRIAGQTVSAAGRGMRQTETKCKANSIGHLG
jgi:hypothetical protein